MKKIFLFLVFMLIANISFAAEIATSDKLIDKGNILDNKEVLYKGEAVGDIMKRGEYFWVNVLEGSNAIGIWAPKNLKNIIQYTGDYKHKGDIILVKGIFHKACREHGGDLDIHAQEITKSAQGYEIKREISKRRLTIAAIFVIAALVAGASFAIQKNKLL